MVVCDNVVAVVLDIVVTSVVMKALLIADLLRFFIKLTSVRRLVLNLRVVCDTYLKANKCLVCCQQLELVMCFVLFE